MRVCMLVRNSFEFDARVTKEAVTLVEAGHDVLVVAVHVPGVTQMRESRPDGIDVVRVPRIHDRLRAVLPASLAVSTTTPGSGRAVGGASTVDAWSAAPPGRRPRRNRLARRILRMAAQPVRWVNDVVVSRRMAAEAVAARPHVVHAHDLNTLHVGVRAARRTGARLVYDAHELHTARNDATAAGRAIARRREAHGARAADGLITATDTWADRIRDLHGVERPAVVRNMPTRTPIREPVDLRARLRLPSDATILLYQGSIQTNRGIEQAIDALRHLRDAVVVVCGYGAHRPVLEARTADAGLGDRVRFDGPVPNTELLAYSAGADIGLCLIVGASESYRTSLPNKLYEYLMAGLPVVASEYPEMGRVIRETGAGEVCDPLDVEAVAAAVERLREPARLEQARAAARAAAAHLDWSSQEDALLGVYERLATAGGEPGHAGPPTTRS